MPGMGPPPKSPEQRRRRNASVAMTELPNGRRTGRAPRWPLVPDVVLTARRDLAEQKVERFTADREALLAAGLSVAAVERRLDKVLEQAAIANAQLAAQRRLEAELWRDLWRLPQAAQWERLGWTREVAQYVRHKVLAELGDLEAAREARQWSDRLGLTPLAMLRLRWVVVEDEVSAKRADRGQRSRPAPAGGDDPLAALHAV